MIKVSVFWAEGPDARFDFDYYLGEYMRLLKERFEPMGLVRLEVDKGLAGGTPANPARKLYRAVSHLVFDKREDFERAFWAHSKEIIADRSNFTNITPQYLISEVLA